MNALSQHFEAVKARAALIKPPSKLRLLASSLLVVASVLAFLVAVLAFFIALVVWIAQLDPDFIFAMSKYSFIFSTLGWIFSIYFFRSYFKEVARFKNTTVLRKDFKLNILPHFISSKYRDINYKFDGIVDESHILESNFFSPSLLSSLKDRWFFGDDYFSGNLENVDFEFCELYYKTRGLTIGGWALIVIICVMAFRTIFFLGEIGLNLPDLGGDEGPAPEEKSHINKQDRTKVNEKAFLYGTKTNFRGFFLYADFHKKFEGTVNIRTKNRLAARKMFDFSKKLKKIRVENSTIDKKYVIRATDTQMAYYVLSPAIVDAIDILNKRIGKHISITLKDGKLYLIAPMSKDFFENITIEGRKIKVNTLEDIKNDLDNIRNLISELNISNRIWTKE